MKKRGHLAIFDDGTIIPLPSIMEITPYEDIEPHYGGVFWRYWIKYINYTILINADEEMAGKAERDQLIQYWEEYLETIHRDYLENKHEDRVS